MCVDKTWNLKYNRTEMTAATNEYYIGWFFFLLQWEILQNKRPNMK